MARKRPNEPIAPATIPGQPLDPKISVDDEPEIDEHEESDAEQHARESETAFDQSIVRLPPG